MSEQGAYKEVRDRRANERDEEMRRKSTAEESGGDGGGDTRVPIPNTTVKTSSADDT